MALDAIRTMHARDAVASKFASAFVTIDGNRYLLFQAKNLEAKAEKEKTEIAILGKSSKGNKTTGIKYSGSMTIYKNTPLFDDMLLKFQETGEDTYFDMQISNEDPTSRAGRNTVILKDCNIDSAIIASFDAEDGYLEQDVDFTFEGWERPERFAILDGMNA